MASIDAFATEPDGTNGFLFYSPVTWSERTDVKLGFLDSFKFYSVVFTTDNGFQYYSRGSRPVSIEYVSPEEFKITDTSLHNFSFSTSTDYISAHVNYTCMLDNKLKAQVTYHNPKSDLRHFDPFTPELIEKFSIPVDNLRYWSSTFVIKSFNSYEESFKWFSATHKNDRFSETSITRY